MSTVYIELHTREMIPEEDALAHAIINTFGVPDTYDDFIKHFCWGEGEEIVTNLLIKKDKETQKSFVDWFFSGNWFKEDINI